MIQSGGILAHPRAAQALWAAFLSLCWTYRLVTGPPDGPLDGGRRCASLLCLGRYCPRLPIFPLSSTLQSHGSRPRFHYCFQAVPSGLLGTYASSQPRMNQAGPCRFRALLSRGAPLSRVPSTCPRCCSPGRAEHFPVDLPVQGAISVPLRSVPDAPFWCIGPPSVPDVPVQAVGDPSLSLPPARGDPPTAVLSLGRFILCAG